MTSDDIRTAADQLLAANRTPSAKTIKEVLGVPMKEVEAALRADPTLRTYVAELARNLVASRKRDLAAAKLAATNFVPYLEPQDLSQRFMHAPGAPRN